jgi:hypothetical protein
MKCIETTFGFTFALLFCTAGVMAQERGALPQPGTTQPATTQPATTKPARRQVTAPPGFNVIKLPEFTLIVEPTDEAWVVAAGNSLTPTTQPTTRASDVLERSKANRERIANDLATLLALPDSKPVVEMLAETLEPELKKITGVPLPLVFIVAQEQRLKELLRGGWSDPRFVYNRATDGLSMDFGIRIGDGSDTDDILLPVFQMPGTAEAERSQKLQETIRGVQAEFGAQLSARAMAQCQSAMVGFVTRAALSDREISNDQEWFVIGLAGLLSTRELTHMTGLDPQLLQRALVDDNPQNPIRATAINLLKPMSPQDLRPEATPFYIDAFKSKAARVVKTLLDRGGEDSIPKLLKSIRDNPAADGAALLDRIRTVTGVDLSADVIEGK